MKLREKLERLMKANWRIPKEFGSVHDFGGARSAKAGEWVYEIAKLEVNYARLLRVARAVQKRRMLDLTYDEIGEVNKEIEEALKEAEHLL